MCTLEQKFTMKRLLFLSIFTLLLVSACKSSYVAYDYAEDADFGKYVSFNFYEPDSGLSDEENESIMDAIQLNLEEKGLVSKLIAKSSIHFEVNFYETNVSSVPITVLEVTSGIDLTRSNFYMELTIEVADALTNELLWQGVIEKRINSGLNEENRDMIFKEMVDEVMATYPPKTEETSVEETANKKESEASEESSKKESNPEK